MRHALFSLLGLTLLAGCFGLDATSILGGPQGTYSLDGDALRAQVTAAAEALYRVQRGWGSGDLTADQDRELQSYLDGLQDDLRKEVEGYAMEVTLQPGGTWHGSGDAGNGTGSASSSGTWELQGEALTLKTFKKGDHELQAPEIQKAVYHPGEIHIGDQDTGVEFVLRRK